MFRSIASLAAVAVLLGGCQTAGQSVQMVGASEMAVTRSMTVASGAPTKVAFIAALNPDCTVMSSGTTRISGPPSHGKLTLTRSDDYPNFPKANPRSSCNQRRVSGARLTYTAQPGYVGEDVFEYDIFTATGGLIHSRVSVSVR